MAFHRFVRALSPIALAPVAVAAAAMLAGCDGADVSINGGKGQPLAELDMTGAPPKGLILLGPDEVRLRSGEKLAITVDGDPALVSAMRFTLKDGTLGILRDKGSWTDSSTAIVNVTMPAPETLVAAGSGTIRAEGLAPRAEVTIAGSGDVETLAVAATKLDVTIAGSGSYRAAGTAENLEMTIAGSGDAAMEGLKAQTAKITIAGTGRSRFASDGTVTADILGSGEVQVRGQAKC
ncbi:MAG: hypothetical protein RIQ46_1238 [Pseudomonadota bacterium]|jgi:hypothetical protein